MPLAARGTRLAVLIACVLLTGCGLGGCGLGGSVADSDRRSAPATERRAPAESPFCAASRANSEAIGPLNRLVGAGTPDRAELVRAVDLVRRAGADMVSASPTELRADVQQTVDAVDLQLDALLTNGGDGRAVNRDPQVSARLSSPELAAAGERVTSYVTRNCAAAATDR